MKQAAMCTRFTQQSNRFINQLGMGECERFSHINNLETKTYCITSYLKLKSIYYFIFIGTQDWRTCFYMGCGSVSALRAQTDRKFASKLKMRRAKRLLEKIKRRRRRRCNYSVRRPHYDWHIVEFFKYTLMH